MIVRHTLLFDYQRDKLNRYSRTRIDNVKYLQYNQENNLVHNLNKEEGVSPHVDDNDGIAEC